MFCFSKFTSKYMPCHSYTSLKQHYALLTFHFQTKLFYSHASVPYQAILLTHLCSIPSYAAHALCSIQRYAAQTPLLHTKLCCSHTPLFHTKLCCSHPSVSYQAMLLTRLCFIPSYAAHTPLFHTKLCCSHTSVSYQAMLLTHLCFIISYAAHSPLSN